MPSTPESLTLVPLEHIGTTSRNPRQRLTALDELAQSIRAYGLLQPVLLRPIGDSRFELIAGHRRLAAARALGWTTIPAIVREAEADHAYLLTLVENLQRADLSAREEASALETLLRERNWSTRQVAHAIKRSPAYVSKRLRVFEDVILAPLVLSNGLTVSAAEELLPLKRERKRELAERAIAEQWEHGQLRAAIRGTPDKSRALAGLRRQVRTLRKTLGSVPAWELSDSHRRELRLLFMDLVHIARAPAEKRPVVFPELPVVRQRARRTTARNSR